MDRGGRAHGLEWAPEAEVRILRVPPFALGIAKRAVEEYVLRTTGGPRRRRRRWAPGGGATRSGSGASPLGSEPAALGSAAPVAPLEGAVHGNGSSAASSAGAEPSRRKRRRSLARPKRARSPAAAQPRRIPHRHQRTPRRGDPQAPPHAHAAHHGHRHGGGARARGGEGGGADEADGRAGPRRRSGRPSRVGGEVPVHRANASSGRGGPATPSSGPRRRASGCRLVPLIARPLARNTVERFAREHGFWRMTTRVMDENKQAMIEADEFDMDTMLVMFNELQAKQIRAEAEGVDGALARDAALHRGGEGAGRDTLPDPRHREEGRASVRWTSRRRRRRRRGRRWRSSWAELGQGEGGGGRTAELRVGVSVTGPFGEPAEKDGWGRSRRVEWTEAERTARRSGRGHSPSRAPPRSGPTRRGPWGSLPILDAWATRAISPQAPRPAQVPHVVAWNLTRRCNLACAHCYIAAGSWHSARRRAPHRQCRRIIDEILELNPAPMLILSGGEPLLRDDLEAIAAHARRARRDRRRRRPTAHGSPTNGSARSRTPGVRGVAVSVDSLRSDATTTASATAQRRARGDARGRRRGCARAPLDFVIQTTRHPREPPRSSRLVAWAADQGAVSFNLYFLVATGRGGAACTGLSPAENEDVLARARRTSSATTVAA